jgi:hypothetical protein
MLILTLPTLASCAGIGRLALPLPGELQSRRSLPGRSVRLCLRLERAALLPLPSIPLGYPLPMLFSLPGPSGVALNPSFQP